MTMTSPLRPRRPPSLGTRPPASNHRRPTPALRGRDGSIIPVETGRWRAAPPPEEELVLAQVVGPALDVGSGPGRHVLALAEMGVPALGIDISPVAVRVARGRGATVLQRCVFRSLPLDASWRTVLLLDGNVGIGGRPADLLRRIRQLLAPDGQALVELDPPGTPTRSVRFRFEHGDSRGPWFDWARVAAPQLGPIAETAGLEVSTSWVAAGRWFARLHRASPTVPAPTQGEQASHDECALCAVIGAEADPWAMAMSEGA